MVFVAWTAGITWAGPLDELDIKRWEKLRVAERYQLEAAEKLYRQKQYQAAADEYEKFLKLYERSEGASYAQLMWSHCQVQLRKLNTALKDGYQTVLDYFPESPEAPIAALLSGRTLKDMGDLKAAKKAYAKAIETYPQHFVAVLARVDLVDLAAAEKDEAARVQRLRELTFDAPRTKETIRDCVQASQLYAQHAFATGQFDEGLAALATSYKPEELPAQLLNPRVGRLGEAIQALMASKDESERSRGDQLTQSAVGWLKAQAKKALAEPKTKDQAAGAFNAAVTLLGYARRPQQQKELLDEMLAALGTSDALLLRLATWYKDNNQREKARETYRRFSDTSLGQSHVAASYVEEQAYDRAIEVYRQLAAQDDKNASRWLAEAAWVYRLARKPEQAIALYRDLLTTDPAKAAEWQWQIAETYFSAGRWKEAIMTYRGTEKFPLNYDRMASAYRQMKQWDEAIALYRQIMAGSPPHASKALWDIALTEEEAGRTDAAIKSFKLICDKFPKSPEGSKAHAHLNQKYHITVTLGGAKD